MDGLDWIGLEWIGLDGCMMGRGMGGAYLLVVLCCEACQGGWEGGWDRCWALGIDDGRMGEGFYCSVVLFYRYLMHWVWGLVHKYNTVSELQDLTAAVVDGRSFIQ